MQKEFSMFLQVVLGLFTKPLQPQQNCGDPWESYGDIALDDLVVALGGKFVPGDFFFAAGARVGAVGHWGGTDFNKAGPVADFRQLEVVF